jgi:hypothetical protein
MYLIKKIRFLILLILFAAVLTSGCSNNTDYLKAKSLPPITVPDKQDKERVGELYRVPEIKSSGKLTTNFRVPLPPAVGVQDDAKIASLQVMGKEFWILNAQTPATTWSRIVNYWQTIGVPLVRQDLNTAVLETKWFKHDALQPGFAVRYQLQLEQGLQAGTTEIHFINVKNKLEDIKDFSNTWPAKLDDPLHARVIADEVVKTLNDDRFGAGDSLLATKINLPPKVQLLDDRNEVVLSANISKQRLARAFEKALNENGLTTYDSNVDGLIYHFDEDKGSKPRYWFTKFLSSKALRNANNRSSEYSLEEILTSLPDEPAINELFSSVRTNPEKIKKLSDVPGYLLVARQENDGTIIYLRDGYGKTLSQEKARELFDTIRLRLI